MWSDKEHLEWLYWRMVHVHQEPMNVDYMIRFRSIIDAMRGDKRSPQTKNPIPNLQDMRKEMEQTLTTTIIEHDKRLRYASHKDKDLRTKEDVLLLQNSVFGCCNRHADNQACNCLQEAIGTTGCTICPDPNCRIPGEKH